MKQIPNKTPRFYGYDNYPRDDEGKILLDRAEDGKIIIKRLNTIAIGEGLLALCDGAKIAPNDWVDLRRGFYLEEADRSRKFHYCIGGSDAGAVKGLSSFSSPLDIYNAKKTMEEPNYTDETDYLFKYGHQNEPLIAEGFAALTKMEVFKNDAVFFNEKTGFVQANVDYFIREPGPDHKISILEIKTTNQNSSTYQNAANNEVPLTYYTQAVLHYPLALRDGFNVHDIYFAIGCDNILGNIRICHYKRCVEKEDELLQAEKQFVDCLHNDTPPKDTSGPVQRLERSGLKQADVKPIAVKLDDIAKAAAAELLALNVQEKNLNAQLNPIKKRKEELQAIICQQIGDASMSVPFNIGEKKYVAKWSGTTRETVDKTVLKNKYPTVYEDTVIKTISRKFSLSLSKTKEAQNNDTSKD